MPSFLMDLAHEIEVRLGVDKEVALRLADVEVSRLRAKYAPLALTRPELSEATAGPRLREFMTCIPCYAPGKYTGDGIVVCAGGYTHFRYAWVCINMLRRMGCDLPIELWHYGPYEFDEKMAALVRPLRVTPVNALDVRKDNPTRNLLGYAIKPYATLHSSFERVLLLDADNVPVTDVTALFSWPEFIETGSIFWPDEHPIPENSPIWDFLSLQWSSAASFESGQLIVNKRRAWKALYVASYFTSHGDFYYRYLRGDRDCYQLAWLCTQTPYTMVPHSMRRLPGTMLQHDFRRRVVFQHRNGFKWDDLSKHVPGFAFESECIAFFRELENQWDGTISGRRSGCGDSASR